MDEILQDGRVCLKCGHVVTTQIRSVWAVPAIADAAAPTVAELNAGELMGSTEYFVLCQHLDAATTERNPDQ